MSLPEIRCLYIPAAPCVSRMKDYILLDRSMGMKIWGNATGLTFSFMFVVVPADSHAMGIVQPAPSMAALHFANSCHSGHGCSLNCGSMPR